jgi:NAD(P)-dependent dehydrogenase (short-subunit alcohol dehydrogenase family)
MPENIAFVTGADRGLGLALCAGLLERGWLVFGGQYLPEWPELEALAERFPGRLVRVRLDVNSEDSAQEAARLVGEQAGRVDALINNAGVISSTCERSIREPQDYAEMHRLFDTNSLGPLRVVEAFVPLIDRSALKRLCFVSSEAGSIGRAGRTAWFGYCMSKAALNMAVRLLFNHLRPDGYTFRVYHPGWVRSYMLGRKNHKADLEPEEAARPALDYFLSGLPGENGGPAPDEDHLVMRDYQGQEWPW